MNTLREAVHDYLNLRRSLGFKLRETGKQLLAFVMFMEQRRASYITPQLALTWAQQPSTVQPAEWARRLSVVRTFARHRSATDPRTQIPPEGLLPYRAKRAQPYLYSAEEIENLLHAALSLPARGGLRPWTYHCLFGLLTVTGLRIGEARNLDLQDVDLSFTRTQVHFITRPEVESLLAAPDQRTWFGRRDHAFLLVAAQTGLRLSEMTGLTRGDVTLGTGAHVHVIGKGRKERCVPLAKPTVAVLKRWLCEPARGDGQVLFPNARGSHLSPDGVHYLLVKHSTAAAKVCPSLKDKRVTVHVLRHTMALDLLQAGVDRSVIALWLGHESVSEPYDSGRAEITKGGTGFPMPPSCHPFRWDLTLNIIDIQGFYWSGRSDLNGSSPVQLPHLYSQLRT